MCSLCLILKNTGNFMYIYFEHNEMNDMQSVDNLNYGKSACK